MAFVIRYYSVDVQSGIASLPASLIARYIALTERMIDYGPNLGAPHTKALGDGLFELRLKSADGIARVFFALQAGQIIVMLHSLVKKSQKTPPRDLRLAVSRLQEIRRAPR